MKETLNNLIEFSGDPEMKEAFNLSFFDQYQFDSFITSLDRRSDDEVYSFLKQNLVFIVNCIVQNQWANPGVLVSEKFIRNFCRVISELKTISQNIRIAANKICYDFSTSGINDSNTRIAVMNLARAANNVMIQQLISIDGLDEPTASNLALCRYSSLNERTNVRRLNFVICTKDIEVMTVQTIVKIYEKFFDRVGTLFKETMWEYYTPEQKIDFGSDFSEIYSTISLALLTIVNNMTMVDIERLIRGYVSDWEYMGKPPVRFSLISISSDYGRVQQIVEMLREQKIYVP